MCMVSNENSTPEEGQPESEKKSQPASKTPAKVKADEPKVVEPKAPEVKTMTIVNQTGNLLNIVVCADGTQRTVSLMGRSTKSVRYAESFHSPQLLVLAAAGQIAATNS